MKRRSVAVVFAALVLVLLMTTVAHAKTYNLNLIEDGWKTVKITGPDNMYVTQEITTWPEHFDGEVSELEFTSSSNVKYLYKYAKDNSGEWGFYYYDKSNEEFDYNYEITVGGSNYDNTPAIPGTTHKVRLYFMEYGYDNNKLGVSSEGITAVMEFPVRIEPSFDFKSEFTYNGKTKKPDVKPYYEDTSGSRIYIPTSDYTVTYPSPSKDVGTYKFTVKYNTSDYIDYEDYQYYSISPRKPTINKVTSPGKGQAKVTWKKFSKSKLKYIDGFVVRYSRDPIMDVGVKKVTVSKKKTSVVIKKLKSKKKYYFTVQTYKKNKKGKKVYSYASKTKSVKIK